MNKNCSLQNILLITYIYALPCSATFMITCKAQNKHSGSTFLIIRMHLYHILTQTSFSHPSHTWRPLVVVSCFTDIFPRAVIPETIAWNVVSTDLMTNTPQITDYP